MESRPQQQASQPHEVEHYEEPPKMTLKNSLGVILALIALAVIGVCGYVWLTPGMTFGKLLGGSAPGSSQMPASASEPMVAGTAPEHFSCDYCGMFADKSASYVKVTWSDGMLGHFDSWDCVFNYSKDNQLELTAAEISRFGGAIDQPEWIKAETAWYLYNMDKPVEGSMPPYIAAFTDRPAAEAARTELGGEVVDFVTLRSKWQ